MDQIERKYWIFEIRNAINPVKSTFVQWDHTLI